MKGLGLRRRSDHKSGAGIDLAKLGVSREWAPQCSAAQTDREVPGVGRTEALADDIASLSRPSLVIPLLARLLAGPKEGVVEAWRRREPEISWAPSCRMLLCWSGRITCLSWRSRGSHFRFECRRSLARCVAEGYGSATRRWKSWRANPQEKAAWPCWRRGSSFCEWKHFESWASG